MDIELGGQGHEHCLMNFGSKICLFYLCALDFQINEGPNPCWRIWYTFETTNTQLTEAACRVLQQTDCTSSDWSACKGTIERKQTYINIEKVASLFFLLFRQVLNMWYWQSAIKQTSSKKNLIFMQNNWALRYLLLTNQSLWAQVWPTYKCDRNEFLLICIRNNLIWC